MPFYRPTLQEIANGIFTDVVGRLKLKAAVLRRSLAGVISRALAGAVHGLYGYITWLSKQIFVHQCDDEYLDHHGAERGIGRKPANTARGFVNARGTTGLTLKAGTKLRFGNDRSRLYYVRSDVDFVGGVATPLVYAVTPGEVSNLQAGAVLYLITPISGIQSAMTVGDAGIIGGADPEENDLYRERILDKIRNPPHGGNANDYVQWALEVPGIERAWPLPNIAGLGTVGVMVARGIDAEDPRPDAELVAMVKAHIEEQRPVTAEVYIIVPELVPLNAVVYISPNTQAIRDAVLAEMQDFLIRDGQPDSYLRLSRISETISGAAGEHHHELAVPVADIYIGKTELPVLGKFIFEDFDQPGTP